MGGVLKFVMFGVNFLFLAMGATMLGVGIWMSVDDEDARDAFAVAGINEDLYWTSVYFMIATGVFIFVVAFLGMFGAFAKAKWALYGYIGVIGLAIIIQLNVIILTAIFWDSIDENVEENMKTSVKTCYVNEVSEDDVSQSWDAMQTDFKCCGSSSYKDYEGSVYQTANPDKAVPYTCCVMNTEKEEYSELDVYNRTQCSADAKNPNLQSSASLHMQGCYPAMKDHLDEHSALLIALTCTFAILEISGIVIAFLLLRDD